MRRLLLLLSLLFMTPDLEAALVESALTGRVTSGEAPAANVSVTVTSLARKTEWHTVTNARGVYWLAPLPPGAYDITFARSGLVTLTRRGVIELARVERVDALLEPSEDEDVVSSTTRSVHAGSTTAITTYFTNLELDRLPLRGRLDAASLAPTPFAADALAADALIDGARISNIFLGDESVDELSVIRGAAPADVGSASLLVLRTRSGRDQFQLSLRDTWSNGDGSGHLLETASGGRIVPDRLWFFAGGWGGDAPYAGRDDVRGVNLALDARLTDAQRLETRWLDSDGSGFGSTLASVRYAAIPAERLLAHALVARGDDATGVNDTIAAKVSYVAAAHVLSAGVDSGDDRDAVFFTDRFSANRWTVSAGVRATDDDLSPRLAGTYDLFGDGRHSLSASFGEYAVSEEAPGTTSIFAAGYTLAIDQFASVRADYLRYEGDAVVGDSLQAEARMRLFDRIETGATYGYHDLSGAGIIRDGHQGAIWGGIQLPLSDYEAGFTLMERYEGGWSTDLAVRFIVPFDRYAATFAADVVNAFDTVAHEPRTVRIWVRLAR